MAIHQAAAEVLQLVAAALVTIIYVLNWKTDGNVKVYKIAFT